MGLVELEDVPHGLMRLGSVTPAIPDDTRDQVGLIERVRGVQGAVLSL